MARKCAWPAINLIALVDFVANLDFEPTLWLTTDKLHSNMDGAEYKHVVLGLIFLKYISDVFEEPHQKLLAGVGEATDPEDRDEYRADNVFWVPTEAHWQTRQDNDRQPTVGKLMDEAMVAVERDNPQLKGILPKDFRFGPTVALQSPLESADREHQEGSPTER